MEKIRLKVGWRVTRQISIMTYPTEICMTVLQMDGVVKENSVDTPWVTGAKLLKCIQAEINDEKKDGDLAVCGVWKEGMYKVRCPSNPYTLGLY